MNIPSTVRAGDYWEWTEDGSTYPATTYTMKVSMQSPGKPLITLTASADGIDHKFAVLSATSAGYKAGNYQYMVYVLDDSVPAERTSLGVGNITILPDLATASAESDFRTHAEKVLAALEAMMESRATKAQQSMSIMGRAIMYMRPDELIRWRSYYKAEVAKEKGDTTVVRAQFGRTY